MKKLLLVLFIAFNLSIYSQNPNYEWAVQSIGASNEDITDIAKDNNGNIYVTGSFSGISTNLGGFILTNSDVSGNTSDLFVAKYSNQGTIVWVKNFGSIGYEGGTAISINQNGTIFITGLFGSSNFYVENTNLVNTNTQGDLFLISLSSNGDVLWAKSAGGMDGDVANGIASSNNSVSVIGRFNSASMTFGDTTILNNGVPPWSDIFVVNYDLNGNVNWARNYGGTNSDSGKSVVYDNSGNLILTGYYGIEVNFDTVHLAIDGYGLYLSKLNSSGEIVWAYGFGSTCQVQDITLDQNQNIIMTGYYDFDTAIGQDSLLDNQASGTFYVAKLTPEGTPIWLNNSTNSESSGGIGVTTDQYGNIFTCGSFIGDTISFDQNIFINNSTILNSKIFITKYNSNGNFQWGKISESSNSEAGAQSILCDLNNNLYIGGVYSNDNMIFGSHILNNTNSSIDYLDFFLTKMSNVSSLNELNSESELTISPNPSSGIFNLNLEKELDFKVKVYDVFGRLIYSDNSQKTTINIENQEKGIYFVEIETSKESYSQKIILE